VIETGGDGSGTYHDFTNRLATHYIGVDQSNGDSYRVLLNDDGIVCREKIPVRRGLFAVVGHTNDDNTDFIVDGIFPEYRIESHNDYRGITGTCMNSLAGVTPETLSRG